MSDTENRKEHAETAGEEKSRQDATGECRDSEKQPAAGAGAETTAEDAGSGNGAPDDDQQGTAEGSPEGSPEGKLKGADKKRLKRAEAELEATSKKLAAAETALAEEKDKYLRMLAEYDNFRRRTAKEKEGLYTDAYADAVKDILPIIDNLERAAASITAEEAESGMAKGVNLTLKSARDALSKLGVTEVETKTFDASMHNAIAHIDDDSRGEGEIVEVFQKGYAKGNRIIRYAMVKVAN